MPNTPEQDRPGEQRSVPYEGPTMRMRYVEGAPIDTEHAKTIGQIASDVAASLGVIHEDALDANATKKLAEAAGVAPDPAAAMGPENTGGAGEKVVPDWMIEKYRAHHLSSPIEDTGWLFHDDSINNYGMVVIASTTRPVIKEFPYSPTSGTDHMRSKAKALVYASERPETQAGFVAPAGELVSEPVYPRMRLGGGDETAAKLAAADKILARDVGPDGPSM